MSRLTELTAIPELIRDYNGRINRQNMEPGGIDPKSFEMWASQHGLFFWSVTLPGTAFVGTTQAGLVFPSGVEMVEVRVGVDQAPTGSDLIVNVKQNGTAIFTSAGRPRILAGTTTAAVAREFTTAPLFAQGDRLTVDVDQVGSTVAGGSDLYICGFGRERST